jgi:hypothetical protein
MSHSFWRPAEKIDKLVWLSFDAKNYPVFKNVEKYCQQNSNQDKN